MDKSGTSLDFQLAATWAMDKGAKIYKWLNDLHFIPLNIDTCVWRITTTQVLNFGWTVEIISSLLNEHDAELYHLMIQTTVTESLNSSNIYEPFPAEP